MVTLPCPLITLTVEGDSYEPAAPYTHNQNVVSERKIRTIVERARTLLLEASLPERFWADAIATVVYILNRSPTRALTGKTPFEAWSGSQPNLAHLRRFGCATYLHIPDAQRTKLKQKACLCTFLGYVLNTTKQWRQWDGRQQKIVIGSNIRFNENGFGSRRPEDPKMLEEISDDQTDQLSPACRIARGSLSRWRLPHSCRVQLTLPKLLRGQNTNLKLGRSCTPCSALFLTSPSPSPHSVSTTRARSPLITRPWAQCYDIYRLQRILVFYIKENPRPLPCQSPSATRTQTGQEI